MSNPIQPRPRVKYHGKARSDKLYSQVVEQIRNGTLKPGDPLLPSRRLCVECGISYRATLQALHRLQREGFVICRPGAGTYVTGPTNGAGGRPQGRTIEIIIGKLDLVCQEFYRTMLQALQQHLAALQRVAHITDGQSLSLDDIVSALREKRGDAVILMGSNVAAFRELPGSASPTVFLSHDAPTEWHESEGYDVVSANSVQGGALAARHLRDHGVRHPAIIAVGDATDGVSPRRIRGFEAGWGEPIPKERILIRQHNSSDEGALAVEALRALNPAPDGVFAASDELADGCCRAFAAQGIRPGRDIMIVGFDAQIEDGRAERALTSVQTPFAELGRMAALMAVERAQRPKTPARWLNLACSLRLGNTT